MANITTRLDKGRKLTSSEIDNNFAELNSELSTKISENSDINVNNIITAGNIVPTANAEYSLGSSEFQWKDLYVSSSTIYIGNVAVSVNEEQNLSIGNAKVVTDQNIGEIVTDLGNIVESINGKTGNVTLSTDDILEGTTSVYFTDTRAVTAIKNDADWNAADWNTAYSWGNHATAGYALSSSLSPVAFSGDYSNLLNTPDLGTASGKNVPSSGDASPDQVVLGNDTRLSDARTPTAHNHNISDITNLQTALDDKVDAVVGKGLSTEDYTTAEKNKLSGIEAGAQVNPTVVANLTMESDTLPLAASQGKMLKEYIDDINLILQSDDSTLDELQEIVEYIKLNREELENLGISSIAGLESALDGKQPLASVLTNTTASFTTELKNKLDAIAEQATKNDTDANLKNRANHTGTQDASTITGLAIVATSGSYDDLSDKPSLGTAAFENSSSFATSTQGSNADIAYGWGDHASAGYALSSSLATVATSGSYNDLSDTPTLGTAASKDAPSDGNATSTQVVLGNDTRLTDARTPTSHTHTAAQVTGLAEVATSGSYNDLSDTPTLGTAAEANTGDFATAAQGAKADTALQPDAIGVTVQGYSAVLNDTTASFTTALKDKLDGIATGATANQTDAHLLNRENHTGTQPASSITGLATVATTGSYDDLLNKPSIPIGTVTSVGMSVPTGLSVTGSPVTGSGTLAVTYADGYAIPTMAKQTNWDTAYGWGNHASAGYAPTASPTFTGTVTLPATVMGDAELTRATFKDCGVAYYNSDSTSNLDYTNGSHQRWAPSGSATLTVTNWPPSGKLGELLIEGVNLGAATITWPTVNWVLSDGTTSTTFADTDVTLQTSGIDWILLWTRDGGSTIYGKVMR